MAKWRRTGWIKVKLRASNYSNSSCVTMANIWWQRLCECTVLQLKKVKVAHTRMPSVGFRCSQPAGEVSHKPGGRLPLLSTRPAVTPATLKRAATNFAAWWTEAQKVWTVCPKTVTRQRHGCDLNPGPSMPKSCTLTTRLPSYNDSRINDNTLEIH